MIQLLRFFVNLLYFCTPLNPNKNLQKILKSVKKIPWMTRSGVPFNKLCMECSEELVFKSYDLFQFWNCKIKPYVINKCCKLKFQEIINFLYETKRFIDNPSFNHRNIYLPYQENAKCQIRQYTIVKMAKLFLHYWKPRRDLKGYCTWKILWFIGIQTLKWKYFRI